MLEGAHPSRAAAVLSLFDAADREAYDQAWRPAHRERTAALW